MVSKVTFEFSNDKAAQHFVGWLSGQGEQDYWQWMEYREYEESGDITALAFNCYGKDKDKFYIPTECGRLDND